MIVVGLTGGIGSGKTTVAKMFAALGIPVYIADIEAKLLMNRSKIIRRKLIALFGDQAYINNQLNRSFIAEKVFKNKELLQSLNAIVHPKLASHFHRWTKKQKSQYIVKEAAILFENGSYKKCDYIITVIALEKDRIKRVLSRDNSTLKKVQSIIDNQWSDQQRIPLSDYIIENSDLLATKIQVSKIHEKILKAIS